MNKQDRSEIEGGLRADLSRYVKEPTARDAALAIAMSAVDMTDAGWIDICSRFAEAFRAKATQLPAAAEGLRMAAVTIETFLCGEERDTP